MGEKYGKCMNFGNCDIADKQTVLAIQDGEDVKCPECKNDLIPVSGGGGGGKSPVPKRAIMILAVLLLCGLGTLGYFLMSGTGGTGGGQSGGEPPKPPEPGTGNAGSASEITRLLEQGEFEKAVKAARSQTGEESKKILKLLETPLKPVIRFQYRNASGSVSDSMPLGDAGLKNLMLTDNNDFRVYAEIPDVPSPVWLYIFHRDWEGKLNRLFPEPEISTEKNPLSGREDLRIPDGDNWFFPDKLGTQGNVPAGETLYFLASFWKSGDVDGLYEKMQQETDAEKKKKLAGDLLGRVKLRSDSNYPFLFYGELSFLHGSE